jgi:hypothetical protein
VSVEGPDDWAQWCNNSENFSLGKYVSEIFLKEPNNVFHIKNCFELDDFHKKYKRKFDEEIFNRAGYLDWVKIRADYSGLIITPYLYERRLADGMMWYYSWDCASGVIWDVSCIGRVEPVVL